MSIPTRLTRDWRTRLTKIEFQHKFPYIDADETIEGFFNHHLSKGDTAHDWDEKFLGFAQWRNSKARLDRIASDDTDSMGLPLDPIKRAKMQGPAEGDYGIRFLEILERHQEAGMTFEQAHAAATTELEGEKPDER